MLDERLGRTPTDRICTDSKNLSTDGQTGITDGTEIRVRGPAVGRKDRDTFVSGKTKQDAVPRPTVHEVVRRAGQPP
ncbi:hypothetical protein O1M63_46125 [Streptomyces mirabilis]|uniref:hypothetical protein n=1 Tax=Streptomyces mirabilis TaxID=68239 RepID=UPI0022C74216|nr:hypothetical protein [Streptomyces mirabilis]